MAEITAQAVFNKAFGPGRSPRSGAYKLGVLHCLQCRIDGSAYKPCPYNQGTAESDAYYSGISEGRELSPVGRAPFGFEDSN